MESGPLRRAEARRVVTPGGLFLLRGLCSDVIMLPLPRDALLYRLCTERRRLHDKAVCKGIPGFPAGDFFCLAANPVCGAGLRLEIVPGLL